jgi:hypothetical protein
VNDDALLDAIQREAFEYFLKAVNPKNGLIADKSKPGWPASIAATGLGLASYPVAVEHGLMTREAAVRVTLATLRFFRNSVQSTAKDATGYKGFYYHFLDMKTGRREGNCELSTVDTAFLLAGALTAAAYFDRDVDDERELRQLADELYRRVDWRWALHGKATIVHGYRPKSGFLSYRWEGYDEALLLYVLALGSPTFPIPPESYAAWLSTYEWKKVFEYEFACAGPLFVHQLSHIWLDFRGIHDAFTREHGVDYFENSRLATYAQREYAIRNPLEFECYHKNCWGFTASDGPGPATLKIGGVVRRFYDYVARGVPDGPDDGTVSPWAVVGSLPFAPEIVMPTIRYFIDHIQPRRPKTAGFASTFNATFPAESDEHVGWFSKWHFGVNQGPMVLMIENYRTDLIWRLMKKNPYVVGGLRRAGFTGGWLQ